MLVLVLGWVAAAIGMLSATPQLLRLLRSRSSDGCSLVLWQLSVGGAVSWTGHGVLVGSANMAFPNVVLGALALAIVLMICADRGLRRLPVLAVSAGIAAVGLTTDLVLGPVAFAVVAFASGVVGVGAQLREIATGTALEGISAPYLVIAVAMQLLWGSWALLAQEVSTLLVASAMGVFCLLNLIWFLLRRAGVPALGRPRPDDLTLAA
ncbi:hypothetical protein GC722_16530 [Auraticoccus sp. F435]|uniref:PQ-loop repeat-containing protein n=1 Tax=Auraticoccus cholistanensis TaxID=2656650 RepID=A0A6A9V1Y1_9ACTN|nr:hypothetical protein [Auraticoccus cholistanensis]